MSSAASRLDIEVKALVFDHAGPPLDVLQLRDIPTPTPKAGELLVRLDNASINPGDFLFIQSLYPEPKKPNLPQQTAGTGGGVGVVVESGGSASAALRNFVRHPKKTFSTLSARSGRSYASRTSKLVTDRKE
jgi:NADPH:quinone reductase-like Zn-dependent oxidoreductase